MWEISAFNIERKYFDGCCSTLQGLLDWFEVDLGSTELLFIQIGLCVVCVFVLYSRVSLSSIPLSSVWPQHIFVFVSTVLSWPNRTQFCFRTQYHVVMSRYLTHVLQCVAVCCSVSQCVAVCCSVLQCVAVRCSVLQCVAVCCSVLQCVYFGRPALYWEVTSFCSWARFILCRQIFSSNISYCVLCWAVISCSLRARFILLHVSYYYCFLMQM